ncbi:MAG: hypothetical protein AAFY20_25640 [Cyanobacteria bacterium J06639_14]
MSGKNKRIVMVVGGKGGTGKTLFARLLYYALVEAKVKAVGVDSDVENPEFAAYHEASKFNVFCLDFLSVDGGVAFLDLLAQKKPDVVVMDMPGASGEQSRNQLEKFNLLNLEADMGYRLTLATVLNNGFSPIYSMEAMMECCQGQADYVAARNAHWEQGNLNFGRWDASEARQKFESLKGIEIVMPALEMATFDMLHPDKSFFEVKNLASAGHKMLATSFLRRGLAGLDQAASYLGLPPAVSAKEAA